MTAMMKQYLGLNNVQAALSHPVYAPAGFGVTEGPELLIEPDYMSVCIMGKSSRPI